MRRLRLSVVASAVLFAGLLAGAHALPSGHSGGAQPPLLAVIWGEAK